MSESTRLQMTIICSKERGYSCLSKGKGEVLTESLFLVRNIPLSRGNYECVCCARDLSQSLFLRKSQWFLSCAYSTKTSLECIHSLVCFITSQQQCILKKICVWENEMNDMNTPFPCGERWVQRACMVRWRGSWCRQWSTLRAKKGWSIIIWTADLLKPRKPITFYINLQN